MYYIEFERQNVENFETEVIDVILYHGNISELITKVQSESEYIEGDIVIQIDFKDIDYETIDFHHLSIDKGNKLIEELKAL